MSWAEYRCVRCDHPQDVRMLDATTLADLPGTRLVPGPHYPCPRCGNRSRPIEWRSAMYSLPIMVAYPIIDAQLLTLAAIHGDQVLDMRPLDHIVMVCCGPPADHPRPPTPAQILDAVGITPPWLDG